MSRLTDAYVAGLIDGEGCIYVVPDRRADRPQKRSYTPHVEVGMTLKAEAILRSLQSRYGGSVNTTRAATDRWDAAMAWKASGAAAVAVLRAIHPYLVLKDEQARLAIRVGEIREELAAGRINARWTEEASARCELIHKRLHELNRKGSRMQAPEAPTGSGWVTVQLVAGRWMTMQRDLIEDLGWEPFSGPWLKWGMGGPHGVFWMRNGSECPKDAVVSSLSDILEPPGPHLKKYCLSPKACRGILRRAERRGRQLPPALLAALETVAGGKN